MAKEKRRLDLNALGAPLRLTENGPGEQTMVMERQNWVWRGGPDIATLQLLVVEYESGGRFSDNMNFN